jgi:3-oxoacyl-[acyl-carrier protein] reductase
MNPRARIALVVGASGGIGEAIARELATRGFRLHLTAHRGLERVAAWSHELNSKAWALDLRDAAGIEAVVTGVVEEEGCLDVLVNAAAINLEGQAAGLNDEDWDSVMDVNLNAAFRLSRAASRPMLVQRAGCILHLSSLIARAGGRGQANYAASKAGLEALVRVLALELGRKGVRVNAIAPGCIETTMTERVRAEHGERILENIALRRFGKPSDVASLAGFLVSDQASYLTGQVIRIDGGMGL